MGNTYGWTNSNKTSNDVTPVSPRKTTSYQPVLQHTTSMLTLLDKDVDFETSLREAMERLKKQKAVQDSITNSVTTYTLILCPEYNANTKTMDLRLIDTNQFGQGGFKHSQSHRNILKTETKERLSDMRGSNSTVSNTLDLLGPSENGILPFINKNIHTDNTFVAAISLTSVSNPYDTEIPLGLTVAGFGKNSADTKFCIPPNSSGVNIVLAKERTNSSTWGTPIYVNKMEDVFSTLFLYKRTPIVECTVLDTVLDETSREDSSEKIDADAATLEILTKIRSTQPGKNAPILSKQQVEGFWRTLAPNFVLLHAEDFLLSSHVKQLFGGKLDSYRIPEYVTDKPFYLVAKTSVRNAQTALEKLWELEKKKNMLKSSLVYYHNPITGDYFKNQMECLAYPCVIPGAETEYLSAPHSIITLTMGFTLAVLDVNNSIPLSLDPSSLAKAENVIQTEEKITEDEFSNLVL